jgi:FtsP/CotA-like multicopper oxidase with cupredoxin domain
MSLHAAILFFPLLAVAPGAKQACSAAPVNILHGSGSPTPIPGLPKAVDVNPDPNIVEIHLEAAPSVHSFKPGEPVHVWAYNGSIPGPLIEGKVGDTLIVHFTNNLPEPTTVHWHGLEVPAEMDGTGISQEAAEPNGGQFRYEFKLLTPALYWYHPHIRTNEQVEKGLYGPLLVRGGDETALDLPEDEYILVLDDVLLDEDGQIAEPFPADPLARAEMQLNGREGNLLLVNGQHLPTLNVKAGWPLRWRIVNAANARFFRLRIPEHLLYRIGGDGGLLEDPVRLDPWNMVLSPAHHALPDLTEQQIGLMLTPGERADVVFTPRGEPGTQLTVYWIDFPRGAHAASYNDDGTIAVGHTPLDGRRDPVPLLRLNLVASDAWDDGYYYVPPAELRVIDALEPDPGLDPLTVRFGHTPPDPNGDVTFFAAMRAVDGQMMGLPFDRVTVAEALHAQVGQTRLIEVVNMTGGIHPYHLHGFFFQPLEIEYVDMDVPHHSKVVPAPYVENKDTILVPARPGAAGRSRSILRALVHFDDTGREGRVAAFGKVPREQLSGGWVTHCHILEHADLGMMTFLELTYPTE